ncbi:tyrosine-type recombinase/integrase [Streptomyces sp. NBC_00201]|uniref:tyrosine-type recombinase/integrase n=1 Tax=unclassified Streptomyces TaxID=2593676 RepID=UPI002256A7BA|nr:MULTISPECIES: tyrosine-type recombinase/integrase [unclassified Streptomyces]MCX5064189.1 tyrosine-type recombinase/integrase [Streptomyces sp. NBC_00452]MCX5251971.1 tyrosine-type recombinase/integrase [Streptomyces sp. NBC_00201]
MLYPGEDIPTAADGPQYSERDLYVSDETAAILEDTDPTETGPMKAFKAWCAQHDRVAVPCTTATYTEYSRHLMARNLKVTTIKNYMSLIKTAMPPGKKPENSLYLRLLDIYRKNNKRALRTRRAFPITLPYLIPMMEKAEADNRPIGLRDSAMLAFGYRFLGRSVEGANLEIEDLTFTNGGLLVWLPEDKTHDEEQNLVLLDRPDIQLVLRLTRWLNYMADQGITTGPVFRHVLRSGKVASAETRGKTATTRGLRVRGQTVNERVKHWFNAAGLVTDGRHVSSQGVRAGAATELAQWGATDDELERAGRWRPGSRVPREVYVRPARAERNDPFARIPVHNPATAA